MIDTAKPIHVQRIHTSDDFYILKDRWNALLAESPTNSFFLRWEWLLRWWEVYNEGNYNLCILLVFRGSELIGIAPFYITKKTWKNMFTIRRLMFLGTKEGSVISEYMDIIYRDGEEESVIREVIRYIEEEDLCDDLYLHMIDTSSKTVPILEQTASDMKFLYTVHDKKESPYINLQSNYDDFLNSLSGSMRYKIRNNQRGLKKYSNVVFRKTADISEFESDFNEFIRLHQKRWETRNMPGSFSTGNRFNDFQRRVMDDMLKNGHLELRFLSVADSNIAVLYNINYNNKIYFYQSGLDVSFDKNIAPGFLLHSHCIEEAIKAGLKEYDFLLMGNFDSYKKQWTKDCKYICDIYIAYHGIIKRGVQFTNKIESIYRAIKDSGLIHSNIINSKGKDVCHELKY